MREVNAKTYTCKINVKFSPKKPSYKKIKWSVKDGKIAYVTPTGIVTGRKEGKTTVIGKTKDGTNKQVKIKVTIKKSVAGPTATPNYENETRKKEIVEDFESYDVGYNWESDDYKGTAGKATKGKEYVNANCGKMTVVKDPENPSNKVLKIEYTGNTQAYDYAPIFNFRLKKTLKEYSAVQLQSRVVSNTADCKYKSVVAYFARYNKITPDYYFDTSLSAKDAETKKIDKELVKFGVNVPMAAGLDCKYNIRPGQKYAGLTYNNKTFPFFYDEFVKNKIAENRTVGYKEKESDPAVGWHQNTLDFKTANINAADSGLINQKNFSMVVGSTFSGKYTGGAYTTVYIDNIAFMEGGIPCTGIKITPPATTVTKGFYTSINLDEDIAYTPAATTQKELLWSSSDESIVKIDLSKGNPRLCGEKAGNATITATCKANPSVKQSFTITVVEPATAASDYSVDLSKLVAKKDDKDTTTKMFSTITATYAGGALTIPFAQANKDHVVIDLGAGGKDLTQYQSISILGTATEQMTFEIYPDGTDFTKDKYWLCQVDFTTYPFFVGSREKRAREGGGYGQIAEENCQFNWIDETDSSNPIHGNLRKARYIVLKANVFTSGRDHSYIIKSITFKKYRFDKDTLPTEAELEKAGWVKA